MKISNLLAVQKECLPPREQSIQNILKVASFAPLVLGVLMMLPALGNPDALFGSLFVLVFTILLSLILLSVQKQAKKKYLKRFTSDQLERMDEECLSAPHYEGLMVTSEALLYFMPAILALPIQELVWIYPVKLKYHKGALLQKTYYCISAITKDKKEYVLLRGNMEEEKMVRSMVFLNEHLKKTRPHLIWGYSQTLSALFKTDFYHMVQMADSRKGHGKEPTLPQDICEPWEQEIFRP